MRPLATIGIVVAAIILATALAAYCWFRDIPNPINGEA
jgi:hypothetical protein